MEKNLLWKIVFIVVLVAVAAWELYPPQKTLKPGLDLAGGTSIIYEIDTRDLTAFEKHDLARRTIEVLRKRIDPRNVQNIVWRPQGSSRIEIQTPLASAETRQKRQVYDQAREALEAENINLATVIRALVRDPNERSRVFGTYARGSAERLATLNGLAMAYDERKRAQQQRDQLDGQREQEKTALDQAGLPAGQLEFRVGDWARLDEQKRNEAVQQFAGNDPNKARLVSEYVNTWADWAKVVDELTDPENGKTARYNKALVALENINLGAESVDAILEMPLKSKRRGELVEELKRKFPDRAAKIDELVVRFDGYRPFRGRLDDPDDLRRMVKGSGVLEFRILPTQEHQKANPDQMASYLEALKNKGPRQASDDKYIWCGIESIDQWSVPGSITGQFGEKHYVLASNDPKEVMLHGSGQRGWKLKRAFPDTDELGRGAIGFLLNERGGNLFLAVTRQNIGRPLCILLDGVAISAPNIRSAIASRGVIQGRFTHTEIEDMVNKLNAGSLPARLIDPPVSMRSIGPSIGAENRDRGIRAGFVGLVLVAGFMAVYYIGSGLVADAALFMNLLFILGVMSLTRATFTLPGIAGIILTIGMSVDANVLIFERIREEQQRGASLRIAIKNGYGRAFRTIFDSNLTTFAPALILYMVASEEIKGFAITLMLGIISSMFTAIFVTRVVFEWLLKKRLIKDHLLMLQAIRNPKINWMGAARLFVPLSAILVAGGLVVFYTRDDTKNNKYDIEFTGGTSVQINLKQSLPRDDVESMVRRVGYQMNNPLIATTRVYSIGTTGQQYEINTTETNKTTASVTFATANPSTPETVKQAILDAQDKLGAGQLGDLQVSPDPQVPGRFVISTTQVNTASVAEVLQAAFAQQPAEVSEPVVHETVNEAIRTAFAGLLERQENLGPQVVSTEKITDAMVDAEPELTPYLNGIKILCSLNAATAAKQIETRLNDLKFKPGMQDLEWFRHKILDTDLNEPAADKLLDSFVYVSVEPEAGFRELQDERWQQLVENEKTKIVRALSLEAALPRVTQIDPSVGKQAKIRAVIAIVLSLLFMIGYIWVRFGRASYGVAAIVALVHDVCITLGAVAASAYIAQTAIGQKLLISDFKINLEMIAALLTLVGYSVNDTIVVFDRIRENRGRLTALSPALITASINQTLSRTVLTSFTTFLVVIAMYIWGGEGLRGFTFVMGLGVIVGTYSSIAIAAPILLIRAKSSSEQHRGVR
jgi:SecD/SecF fusion protein